MLLDVDKAIAQARMTKSCEFVVKILRPLVGALRHDQTARELMSLGVLIRFREILELECKDEPIERHLRCEILHQLAKIKPPILTLDMLKASRLSSTLLVRILRLTDSPLAIHLASHLIESWAQLANSPPEALPTALLHQQKIVKRPRLRG